MKYERKISEPILGEPIKFNLSVSCIDYLHPESRNEQNQMVENEIKIEEKK